MKVMITGLGTKAQRLFDHEAVQSIKYVSEEWQTKILGRLKDDVIAMDDGMIHETCRLLMSWASDAHEHWNMLNECGDAKAIGVVRKLNEFQYLIMDTMEFLKDGRTDIKLRELFRTRYTSDY